MTQLPREELTAKIAAEGEGIFITDDFCESAWELKSLADDDDEPISPREVLAEMDDNQAAMLAGTIFQSVMGHQVDQQHCSEYDTDEQLWAGTVEGFAWEISVDGDNWLIDFSTEET